MRGEAVFELSGSAPPASFWLWIVLIASPTRKNVPSALRIPAALVTVNTVPAPMPVALIAGNRMFAFV